MAVVFKYIWGKKGKIGHYYGCLKCHGKAVSWQIKWKWFNMKFNAKIHFKLESQFFFSFINDMSNSYMSSSSLLVWGRTVVDWNLLVKLKVLWNHAHVTLKKEFVCMRGSCMRPIVHQTTEVWFLEWWCGRGLNGNKEPGFRGNSSWIWTGLVLAGLI